MTTTDPTWRARAACRPGSGHNPDLFYPTEADERTRRQALAICATCSVTFQCLNEANTRRERHGIWGGFERTDKGRAQRPVGRPPNGGHRIGSGAQ
jgi:WhiB family redox-sensing transcriptional regulator